MSGGSLNDDEDHERERQRAQGGAAKAPARPPAAAAAEAAGAPAPALAPQQPPARAAAVHRHPERIVPAGCVWLAVGALHALLLWAWHTATQPLRPPPQAVTATVLAWTLEPLHRQDTGSATAAKKPARRIERAPPWPRSEPRSRRPGNDRAARSAERMPPLSPPTTGAPGTEPPHPQAPATEAPPSAGAAVPPTPPADTLPLLDSPATRDAIRAMARQQPLTEAAQLASSASAPRPGERLGQAIKQAGKGHCAQGEYFGGGMGLLSLPFLVAALARDDCAQ